MCTKFEVCQLFGRPRYPQCQGQVERANQTLKRLLSRQNAFSEEKRWVNILNKTVYEYNKSWHSATNKAPFVVFTGASTRGFNGFSDFQNSSYDQADFIEEESIVEDLEGSISEGPNSPEENLPTCADSVVDGNYKKEYDNRMVRNANKHCPSIVFKAGAEVFLSKDTNGNARYKIKGLETFAY